MGIKIIDIDKEICPLPLVPITCTGWGSCLMDGTGMVSIIPLGSRTGAGIDLAELGLLGLIVVGWGQRWSRPGLHFPQVLPGAWKRGKFTAATPMFRIRMAALKGIFIPGFPGGEVGSLVLCKSPGAAAFARAQPHTEGETPVKANESDRKGDLKLRRQTRAFWTCEILFHQVMEL